MRIRDLKPEDVPVLKAIYEQQGFDYEFPEDLSVFTFIRVAVDENDRPFMALASRRTEEMFMFMDGSWRTPRWRFEAFLRLHESMRALLEKLGVVDVHAWLPPEVEKSFGRRLMRKLNWRRSLWSCFWRLTTPSGN
jgi:hypothetical protein